LYSLWERCVSFPTQRIARSGVTTCWIVSSHSVGCNSWRRHYTAEIPTHSTGHIHVLQNTKYQHVFCEVQLDRRNRREIDKVWPGKMIGRHSLEEMCVKSGQPCPCDLSSTTAWRRKIRVLISASDTLKSSALGSGRLTPGDSDPDTHWNSPSQTEHLRGRKIHSPNENGTPFPQPSSSYPNYYTDWATPPPITYNNSFNKYLLSAD